MKSICWYDPDMPFPFATSLNEEEVRSAAERVPEIIFFEAPVSELI